MESIIQRSINDVDRQLMSHGIVRIPTAVYQMFCDMTIHIGSYYDTEEAKARIMKQLKEFIADKYPGRVIIDVVDFSKAEAEAIHPRLMWGMYVALDTGEYLQSGEPLGQSRLTQITRLLTY